MITNTSTFAFFGTPKIAVWVLEELEKQGLVPALVVTNPDAPHGRKQTMTPPPAKQWALSKGIPVRQPNTLKDETLQADLRAGNYEYFVVAAYGKLIPESVLTIPSQGTLNVHPSLLPKLRGASPIRSAILNDMRETGVTIMLMDKELDHGPILAQETARIELSEWPLHGQVLDERLARQGGTLLAAVIPQWLRGDIEACEQDHTKATFCTKISKEMGELDLSTDSYQNLLKIRAFDGWPGTFFYAQKRGVQLRVKIVDAELAADGTLAITRVIPEGRKEMSFEDFLRG